MEREREAARARPWMWQLFVAFGVVNLLQVLSRLDRFRWFDVVPAVGAVWFLGLAA